MAFEGYRFWYVYSKENGDLILKSGNGYQWQRDFNEASCPTHLQRVLNPFFDYLREAISIEIEHKVPHLECNCGFYAFRNFSEAVLEAIDTNPGSVVLGKVSLWGRVIEHEKGYRGKYAKILEIYKPTFCRCGREARVFYHVFYHVDFCCLEHRMEDKWTRPTDIEKFWAKLQEQGFKVSEPPRIISESLIERELREILKNF